MIWAGSGVVDVRRGRLCCGVGSEISQLVIQRVMFRQSHSLLLMPMATMLVVSTQDSVA